MSDACQLRRWDILKRQLKNLNPMEFQQAVETWPNAILIDCRTANEYQHRHLSDAINMDYLAYDLLERLEALDPEKTYLVYCRTGRRSLRTCMLMKNSGFAEVYNMDGGLVAFDALVAV